MKKYIVYTGILAAGLLIGYFLFNDGETPSKEVSQTETNTDAIQMWTCSMHPQIMRPEPGDCPICGMELIPAESGSEGLSAGEFKMTETAMRLAGVQTSIVGEGENASAGLSLSGKIQQNEELNAIQSSHFAGRIENLNVDFTGEEVRQGQLLATIYSPDLVAAQQELLTAAKLKESQPALYKAVRNKLKLLKLSGAQINKIESSGEVRENFPVYATVSGTVTEKMVSEGDYVKKGQPLYKIANLGSVWAVFDAYESQIASLKEGQSLKISPNAYPGKEFQGKISFIEPVLDQSSRTVKLRVELPNKNGLLKPGMFVKAQLEASGQPKEKGLNIPKTAVLWTGERSLVYVKTSKEKPVFEMREVKLGNASGDKFQILEGLKKGEEVVTNGTFTVDAAAQLQGKSSMMNQKDDEPVLMKMKLPDNFQKEFGQVLEEYFQLKDALVASDSNQVAGYAKTALEKMKNIDRDSLGKMPLAHLSKIEQMLKAISKNNKLKDQRAHFVMLSENMIQLVSNMKDLKAPVYMQHCPMADNHYGANWLSRSEEIRNPYYGEEMLDCGEVKSILK